MAEHLKNKSTPSKVISDKTSIPDLEAVTSTMLQKFPGEQLPSASTCKLIGDVFASLSTARTAYAEAAQGLAQLATLLTPEQYTLVLAATVTPCIQLIIPGKHISPLSTPPPPQQESQTAMGRAEIINFTKTRYFPTPKQVPSQSVMTTPLRVLLAACSILSARTQLLRRNALTHRSRSHV